MRPVAAIVEAAVDVQQIARAIAKEHVALQDDERNADAHEKKTTGYRESAARRRIEIGRLLIEAKHGIKHGGWLPYLEKLGIPDRTAREWMELAGYVDAPKSAPKSNGADLPPPPRSKRRAEKSGTSESAEADEDGDEDIESEIQRKIGKICQMIIKSSMRMPDGERRVLAGALRETADILCGSSKPIRQQAREGLRR